MPVHAQPLTNCILLRCGPDFRVFGDEFCFVVTVTIEPHYTAFLQGAMGRIYPGLRRELLDKLKELGFKRFKWERKHKPKIVEGEI